MMKTAFVFCLSAVLSFSADGATVSQHSCVDISGSWQAQSPTVYEVSIPAGETNITLTPIADEWTHRWELQQEGCLLYGLDIWSSFAVNETTGVPLKSGNELIHGIMNPMGLAVISSDNTTEVPSFAPTEKRFYVTLLENGDLKVVSDNYNTEGHALLYDNHFVRVET